MSPPSAPRQPTSALRAFVQGWKLALQAPAVTVGILLGSFVLEMPANHVRRLVGQDRAVLVAFVQSWPLWSRLDDWMAQFSRGTQGLEWLFAHDMLGFGGLTQLAWNWTLPMNFVLWSFLTGGMLDRLARARPVRAPAFFSACGVYFFRFLRLGAIVGAVYWALFTSVRLLDGGAGSDALSGDATGGHTVVSLLHLVAIVGITVLADYAKVRAVVEDRIGMIGAIAASWRFVRRRPFRIALLFLVGVVSAVVVMALPAGVGVSAASPGWMLLLFALGTQVLYVWIRLAFMASAVVFFQSELAHADYTAAPLPVWPESPAAEAIGNFAGRN